MATIVLIALRAPQTFLHPQFWAEDGAVFFVEQHVYGWSAMVRPYAGYLHFAPRLAAQLATLVSAAHAPALYAGAGVVCAMWSAATIATMRVPFAWLLGAALMMPPHSGEIFGTLTNVQWLMAPALAMIVCACGSPAAPARINRLLFALVASFTGPFSVFLVPLAAWRVWARRGDRLAVAPCVIVIIAGLIQAGLILASGPGRHPLVSPLDLAVTLLDRCVGQLATGHRTSTSGEGAQAFIVALAAAAALIDHGPVFGRLFVFLAAFMASVWLKFTELSFHVLDGIDNGDRYFFVPRLIILWALISLVVSERRSTALLGAAALTLVAANMAQWSKPRMDILPWKAEARRIDRGEAVTIRINPSDSPETGWAVTVPARP